MLPSRIGNILDEERRLPFGVQFDTLLTARSTSVVHQSMMNGTSRALLCANSSKLRQHMITYDIQEIYVSRFGGFSLKGCACWLKRPASSKRLAAWGLRNLELEKKLWIRPKRLRFPLEWPAVQPEGHTPKKIPSKKRCGLNKFRKVVPSLLKSVLIQPITNGSQPGD